ncbi:MAG: SH3 domain-containing protein [Bacteroidota bacterium]
MRNYLIYLIVGLVICACNDQPSEESTLTIPSGASVDSMVMSQHAICLWPKVGLREGPNRSSKYLTTIYFGESVLPLGDTLENEDESRKYIKVQLSDQDTGWVYSYLFAYPAVLSVATRPIELYRRPDMMTFTGESYQEGEIFAMKQADVSGWLRVQGKEKEKDGWIRSESSLSQDPVDVNVASMLHRAMEESSLTERAELLQQMMDNSALSVSAFLGQVRTALTETENQLDILENLPDNQLYITVPDANVRQRPVVEEDNVLFTLHEGNICNIRRRGAKETVNGKEDYWYRISYEGKEGWIFGNLTSKILN